MKVKDSDSWDSLKFYEKRIKELEILYNQSNSKTIKELISKAISESKVALEKNLVLQNQTISFLQNEMVKFDQSILKIDDQINLLNNEINKVNLLNDISDEQRAEASENLNNVLTIGLKTKKNKEDVLALERTVMPQVAMGFQNVLLNLIYKPSSSNFHYDTVVDTIKVVGGLVIPAFDSLMTASSTPLSATLRKKQYLKSGDKVLVYLEQYLDVLNKWNVLADEYYKLIKE